MWRADDVIEMLKEEQGDRSMTSYAATVGCTTSYLSQVYSGKKEPGPVLLEHLGLERKRTVVVTNTYQRKRRWR